MAYYYESKQSGLTDYQLSSGGMHRSGYVRFDWNKDVQACHPHYEDTLVILANGKEYLLYGRGYGV